MNKEELAELTLVEIIKLNKMIDIELFLRTWWIISLLGMVAAGFILYKEKR